jgi:hypothetical protein
MLYSPSERGWLVLVRGYVFYYHNTIRGYVCQSMTVKRLMPDRYFRCGLRVGSRLLLPGDCVNGAVFY